MLSGPNKPGPVAAAASSPLAAVQASGAEACRQQILKIQEAQKRLLTGLQTGQLPLSQVAKVMARLEAELAEAQRGLKAVTEPPC